MKNKYEQNIARRLNETDSSPDTELEWNNLKPIINDVAYDDVGTKMNIKKTWMV